MSFPIGPATQAEIYVSSADQLPLDPDKWESRAAAVLDPGPFDYIAGGAGGESTMRANLDAFARWRLRPAMLAGNPQRDLRVSVLGTSSPAPFLLAGRRALRRRIPTATSRSPGPPPPPAFRGS